MNYLIGLLAIIGTLVLLELGWLWLRYGLNGLSEMIDAVWDVIDEIRFARMPPEEGEQQRKAALDDLVAAQIAARHYFAIPFEATTADLRKLRYELLDKWEPVDP